ncbi:SidA/IucD/PvdA family monooxygenase [Bacillus aerolatus]|uniref:SidA/IucD/PvdA family monooxygenase n=2 Tax=Bacillus aerolatus TaxID=2653354 RepID=A0A6I1FWA0_9BACI|nr:SidA/IucD/PvdA family monooxygenase [Bacillus aerolatus]
MIIGGGIQGCTVASFLLKSRKTTTERLRIIDPGSKPLTNWKRMTSLIEMPFLRSPFVHHIDVAPFSLQNFAKKSFSRNHFYGDYKRPSLELFNAHCDETLEEAGVEKCWLQGRVKKVERDGNHWAVQTEDGSVLKSKYVVIAIGVTEQPVWPEWAKHVKTINPSRIFHIFDQEVQTVEEFSPPFLIIGGGITAAHLAIKLGRQFPGQVTLLTRHPFRLHDFDSDPGWLGQKYLRSFHQISCFGERRKKIRQARHKGSMPRDVYRTLRALEKKQSLAIIEGEIDAESIIRDSQHINVCLSHSKEWIKAGSIVLANGFDPSLPGGDWLESLIRQEHLMCADCGYPIVSKTLEWCPHLFVAGALAELEVGPAARNVSGARMAAERIVTSVQ